MVEFSYKNEGNRMVVLRCIGPSNFFLERVLFPTDILTFMAPTILELKFGEMNYMDPSWKREFELHQEMKILL